MGSEPEFDWLRWGRIVTVWMLATTVWLLFLTIKVYLL